MLNYFGLGCLLGERITSLRSLAGLREWSASQEIKNVCFFWEAAVMNIGQQAKADLVMSVKLWHYSEGGERFVFY